jgi:replicative DNA helicase
LDHAQIILSGILPTDKDRLLLATANLEAEHFKSPAQRTLFQFLEKYFEQTGGILTRDVMLDLLSRTKIEPAKFILFEEIYDRASGLPVTEHEFKYAIDALKKDLEKIKLGQALNDTYDILEKGVEKNGFIISGPDEAKSYMYEQLGQIDKLSGISNASAEGDMRHEAEDIFSLYVDAKQSEGQDMIPTGFASIDKVIGGISYGDLCLIAAYTSQGKSQLCAQLTWEAAVLHGKNTYYATSETVRPTIIRRIVARHSRQPQFETPEGLDSNKIKMGTLSPHEEKVFKAVLDDLKNNKDYGALHISQIPRGATMSYVEARLKRQHQQTPIDLTVWDYLNLLKPDQKRASQREEANDLLKDAKTIAAGFAEGRGIAFVSPWQVSREKYEMAQNNGFYTLDSLADTSEAEKSADLIFALLRFNDSPKKAKLQTLKCRDGAIPPQFDLDIDYRTSFLTEPNGDNYHSMSDFLK